jgi:hypothetical protein
VNKEAKKAVLVLSGLFSLVILYNLIFTTARDGTSSTPTGTPPFYMTFLFTWGPFLVLFAINLKVLRVLRQILSVGERIARILEKDEDPAKSHSDAGR